MRIRVVLSRLRYKDAIILAKIAKKYNNDTIDITTKSELEFRYIDKKDQDKILKLLNNNGIKANITKDILFRGIKRDPFAQISATSVIDDNIIANQLEDLIKSYHNINKILPKKFNIAVLGNKKNNIDILSYDLAFVLATRGDRLGFNLFFGGKNAVAAKDGNIFIDTLKIIDFTRCLIELFLKYDFKEGRSRIKFYDFLEDLGLDNFLVLLKKECKFDIEKKGVLLTKLDSTLLPVEELKQNFAYRFTTVAGDMDSSSLLDAALLAKKYDGFVIFTNNQNFYITNCDNSILKTDLYKKHTPSAYTNQSVVCAGYKACSYATIDTKKSAKTLSQILQKIMPIRDDIAFCWSGCNRGCGMHNFANIGFMGTRIKSNSQLVDGVVIFLGGSSQNKAVKTITAPLDKLEFYIIPIIKFYKIYKNKDESFEDFLKKELCSFLALGFVMELNAKHLSFIPKPTKHSKTQQEEIKDIANQLLLILSDKNNSILYSTAQDMSGGKYNLWKEIVLI